MSTLLSRLCVSVRSVRALYGLRNSGTGAYRGYNTNPAFRSLTYLQRGLQYRSVSSNETENRGNLCHNSRLYTTSQTVDPLEMRKFQAWVLKWWDEEGIFSVLHALNDIRVPFIRDILMSRNYEHDVGCPLSGVKLLDVGCGGGLLCEWALMGYRPIGDKKTANCCSGDEYTKVVDWTETQPLGRLGASVTGIDPLEDNIKIAALHKSFDPVLEKHVQYKSCTVEELVDGHLGYFDAVVASEVLEHVADVESLIQSCFHVLKPGGSLFITTINKTKLSYALAIVVAEKIMGIAPEGTHDWEKFIPPEELERLLESNGYVVEALRGMLYNPFSGSWRWISDNSVNYALHAVKTVAQEQPTDVGGEGEQEQQKVAEASV